MNDFKNTLIAIYATLFLVTLHQWDLCKRLTVLFSPYFNYEKYFP